MLRLSVARDFEKVVVSAEAAFSVRSWPYLRATLLPWLLCSGQRCWTRVASLASHRRSLSGYYRFLSDGKWRLELLFRSLFELIVRTFGLEELTLVLDDTLCPKWGRTIFGVGYHFDHIGELCNKTVWGMDLRDRMYAISLGQREVADSDPLADFVPTSHVAVEIGGGGGLHYHYGTLGQLEHGVNYAAAYLRSIGAEPEVTRPLRARPYAEESKVRLFMLAGHRNMEGERTFVRDPKPLRRSSLRKDDRRIAFKYSLGGDYKVSDG